MSAPTLPLETMSYTLVNDLRLALGRELRRLGAAIDQGADDLRPHRKAIVAMWDQTNAELLDRGRREPNR